MKKSLLIGGGVLVVLVGAALIVPGLIDWNKHKATIIAKIQEATGLTVEIGGDISMAVLPLPHATIEKLSVSNPSYNNARLVTLDKASVSVELFPLLSGKVAVRNVELEKPVISLAVGADGAQSWMTPTLRDAQDKKADAPRDTSSGTDQKDAMESVSLNAIIIKDGVFSYADGKSGKTYNLAGINTKLKADSVYGPYDVNGALSYNGQPIDIAVKSGRMEKGATSLSLQAELKAAQSGSRVSFSGVAGFGEAFDVQGDTVVESADVAALMALATGKEGAPALKQKLSLNGLVTASPDSFAVKNMKLGFGTVKASGSLTASNLKDSTQPLQVVADLKADDVIDLATFMPADNAAAKTDGKKKAAPDKTTGANKSASGFVPETLTLPRDMIARVKILAPAVKSKDVTLKDVVIDAGWQDRKGTVKLTSALPPEGALEAQAELSYASVSRSEQNGSLTLSEPLLTYSAALKTADGAKTALAFLPEKTVKGALPYLHGVVSFSGKGDIRPAKITLSEGAATLQGTTFGLSASYEPKKQNGRDMISLGIGAKGLNIDNWLALGAPAPKKTQQQANAATDAKAAADQKAVIRDAVEKLNLPVDLAIKAGLTDVTFKGTAYNQANILGSLVSNKLTISTFELKDTVGNQVLVAGTVGHLNKLADMDISVQGKTPDVKKLLTGFKVDTAKLPASLNAVELLSEFKGQADKLSFTANLKTMGGSAEASGALADLLGKPVVSDLTARVRHPNYVDVMRLFNPQFKSSVTLRKSMDVFASMKLDNKAYTFDKLQGEIGPATFSGDIKADMSGAKPSITARLQMGDVPLSDLLGQDAGPKGKGGSTGGSSTPAVSQQATRWSRDPINVDWMNKINLDLDVTAKSITYGTWNFGNPVIDATLTDGTLTLTKLEGGLYGGKALLTAKAVAPQGQSPLTVNAKANLQNVALESFVSSFSGSRLVKARGDISLDADVNTAGGSMATLIGALNGKGAANGKDFIFEGFDLARLSRTLSQPSSSGTENITNILGATMTGGSTSFDTLTSAFTITKGVIGISDLTLKGKDATVTSPGTVNLPLWTIDMESSIKLAQPADAPELKVAFKGPLDNPGQTFGKGAMDSYVRQIVGQKVQNVIQDKLGDKLGDNPALQNLLGLTPKKAAPAPAPVPAETTPAAPVTQPEAVPQPQVQPEAQPQPQNMTPEDALKGILNNVMQGR